jgi:hypothetical protein
MALDKASIIVPSCLINGCFDIQILGAPRPKGSSENSFSRPIFVRAGKDMRFQRKNANVAAFFEAAPIILVNI